MAGKVLKLIQEDREKTVWNVYYENKESGRLCRYCVSPMDYSTAERVRDEFNSRYPDRRYPNGKGWYPFSQAWIAAH